MIVITMAVMTIRMPPMMDVISETDDRDDNSPTAQSAMLPQSLA